MSGSFRRMAAVAGAASLLFAAGCGGGSEPAASKEPLSVDTIYEGLDGHELNFYGNSSGIFQKAVENDLMGTLSEKTGLKTKILPSECGINQLAGQEKAGNVTITIMQFCTSAQAKQASDLGLLQKLDTSVVPVDTIAEGTYSEYTIDAFQYAMGLAWDLKKWPLSGKHPTSVVDLFNTEDFPGKRCLPDIENFYGFLEGAALSGGVAKEDMYPLQMDVILKQLDKIRDVTIFHKNAAVGFQSFVTGDCAMAIFPNGSAYAFAQQNPELQMGFTVKDALSTSAPLGIPKTSPDRKAASAFLRWILTDADAQKKFVESTAYLPAALTNPPAIPDSAEPFALSAEKLATTIPQDTTWYEENGDDITSKFTAWQVSGK